MSKRKFTVSDFYLRNKKRKAGTTSSSDGGGGTIRNSDSDRNETTRSRDNDTKLMTNESVGISYITDNY